jgi:uncharacterized protein
MSSELSGLAVVEELARRFRAGRFDEAFQLYHPRVRIEQPTSLPHGGVHEGHAGVRAMGATFAKFWTRTISEPNRCACSDGRVLQITQQTWTALETGKSASVDVVELIAFADGLISEIRVFQQDTKRLLDTLDRSAPQ